ncbi:hypothetical protein MMC18_007740 [Xylographa bjoerkii]|nr:hypothetical protein [Xylographa bjoerkii]
MDISTMVAVSERESSTQADAPANAEVEIQINTPTDTVSDSDSVDFEALYDSIPHTGELPGLRGLSVVGSPGVIDPNLSSRSESGIGSIQGRRVLEDRRLAGSPPLTRPLPALPFRTGNHLVSAPRDRRRPPPINPLSTNLAARLSHQASTYPHSILRSSVGPPPSGPLPASPRLIIYSPLQDILEEPETQGFDPEELEIEQATTDIRDRAEREALEIDHQRLLAEPAQGFSFPLEPSFQLVVTPSTPPLTNSSMTTVNTSDFDRTLPANFFESRAYRSQSPSTDIQNMEVTEIVRNINDNTADIRTQHGVEPEVPEVRLARPRRYSIDELLQLRYVANHPLDHLNFSEEAPVDQIVRTIILPDYTMVAKPSLTPFLGTKTRDPWMSDDDEVVFQGGAAVSKERRSAAEPKSQELFTASRQPFNPPEGDALQAIEGFARFLKEHASPHHKRVTAGGRIVSAGPNSPPPTFHMGFLDGVLQQFDQIEVVREAFKKQARDAKEEERQKAIEESEASRNGSGLIENSSNSMVAEKTDDVNSTSNIAVQTQPEQNQPATSGALVLPPGSQPMLMAGDGTTIFQMGGSMFRAVLRGSETLYELLTPVQPVGQEPISGVIPQPLPQQMTMPMPTAVQMPIAQIPSFTPQQPMFNMQTANQMQVIGSTQTMDSMHTVGSVQSMPPTQPVPTTQQSIPGPAPPAMRQLLPPGMLAMTQPMIPEHVYGQRLHSNSYFPGEHAFAQDRNRYGGLDTTTMTLQPYNPESASYLGGQPSLQVQLRNVESRMRNLMNHKSELEQYWALHEWQMSPMEKISNRDQLRRCTVQYDDLRKMKKTLESSISGSSDGRIGLSTSGNLLATMTRPAPQGYGYNGRDSMRASIASTISNNTYDGENCNMSQGTAGNGRLQTSGSQNLFGNMMSTVTHPPKVRNNSKPLSPSAPAFVPAGMAFSTPQKPQLRHQDPAVREGRSSGNPVLNPPAKHQSAMSGVDWTTIIDANHPAGEIDEEDMKYCEEGGLNDPRKPKQYCTTSLEVTWVIKNVRQHAKLLGCKNGSSKDPEWDAEQDVRHAIFVLRRPIPLAPMLPDFVRRTCPWDWDVSIFNIGQGMGPFWVAPQHYRSMEVAQVEAQVDLWSHERLLVLETKLKHSRDVGHANVRGLKELARRELSSTASSRKRSESIVSWDSDMARAADKARESGKKFKNQTMKPLSQPTATPHKALDDSVFDMQSYRRGLSDAAHLTSEHSIDNQPRNPASDGLHQRRRAQHSYERSIVNDSFWAPQVKTVPVDSATSDQQSNALLRNMLELKVKDWEPLPGETQEEFEEAYFAGKHIFEVAKAGSNKKSDLEFPPMKQMSTKENRPFQNEQSHISNENGPHLRRMGHKAQSSMASPVFHAQGIVPSVTGTSSVSAYLSSNPGRQRQQEQVASFGNNYPRGFSESSESRRQAAFTESPSPRNGRASHPTGHHARTRPGDYSSQYRSTEDGHAGSSNQNPFGYGNPHYYQPPQRRG